MLILINDFDLEKMGRRELSKRCRVKIQDMAIEAATASGMPASTLHCTLYLLTNGLRGLGAGDVVLWSMLEKAFVIHDPHTYLRTWQLLVRQGALGPSDVYAEKLLESARTDIYFPYRRIRDCIIDDFYAGVLQGAQSLLMRLGSRVLPPDGVVQKLRENAGKTATGRSLTQLAEIADCLAELREEYGRFKRAPSLRIRADRLHKLMERSEDALEAIEELCGALGRGRIGNGLGDIPVVGVLK